MAQPTFPFWAPLRGIAPMPPERVSADKGELGNLCLYREIRLKEGTAPCLKVLNLRQNGTVAIV